MLKNKFGGFFKPVLNDQDLKLVTKLVQFLEEEAISIEGIFRIAGFPSEVNKLREYFEKGEDLDISCADPHVIASLFKLYFRNLKEPLLTFQKYDSIIEAAATEEKKQRNEMQKRRLENRKKWEQQQQSAIEEQEKQKRLSRDVDKNKIFDKDISKVKEQLVKQGSEGNDLVSHSPTASPTSVEVKNKAAVFEKGQGPEDKKLDGAPAPKDINSKETLKTDPLIENSSPLSLVSPASPTSPTSPISILNEENEEEFFHLSEEEFQKRKEEKQKKRRFSKKKSRRR